jgi:hypothetical protein
MGDNFTSYAVVRQSDGKVLTFVRPDMPVGWEPEEGFVLVPDDELPENYERIDIVTPVPESISARQIRLWLIQHNISLSTIEETINSISDAITRETVRVEWEYAPYVERKHPWLEQLGSALGLTSQDIDRAFIEASQL